MVKINDIPTLTGEVADRFIKMSEENLKNKGSIDFTKEFNNSIMILRRYKINYYNENTKKGG